MKKFLNKLGYSSEIEYYDRLLYPIILCTIVVSGIFLTLYCIAIPFNLAIIEHSIYISASILLYIPLKKKQYTFVRISIVLMYTLQLTLAVFVWFTFETGFNLFYWLIPMCAFIVLKYCVLWQRILAITISIVASALFFISELIPSDFYLYETSDSINMTLHAISIISLALPATYIFTLLAKSNHYMNVELNYLADKDSLTQIDNRRVLYKNGEIAFLNSKKHNNIFTVVLFDIDFFKKVNDDYGHPVGDELLVKLTKLVSSSIRKTDLFARYGGEEFAIIFNQITEKECLSIVENIQALIKTHVFLIDDNKISITASFGLVQYSNNFSSFEEMMKYVDKALYSAKEGGRDQIKVIRK